MTVSLSAGMRNAVYSMGDIQSQIDTSNKRLATGRKVNDAIDNARAYFAAQGFQKDARDLGGLMDNMNLALKTVQKANAAIDNMRKTLESAQSLARQAASLTSTDPARLTLQGQVADLMGQFSRFALDSGFNGRTLLRTDNTAALAAADNLVVQTNIGNTTSITVTAVDVGLTTTGGVFVLSAAGQGLTASARAAGTPQTVTAAAGADAWNGVNGDARVNGFVTYATAALSQLAAVGSAISTNATVIQLRQDFTKAAARTSNEASDYLVLADINEEGAALSALQTKQQLAVQALSLASRADQAILRLF